MIKNEYLRELGQNEDQIAILRDRLDRESRFRELLGSEHVNHIENISKVTDIDTVDFRNEELLRLKIRTEWDGFIPKQFKKQCQK